MSDSRDLLAALTPQERAAVIRRLETQVDVPERVRRRAEGAEAPLSPAQSRIWYLRQLAAGTAIYNTAIALRLHGPLDVDALERALLEITRRHESLRSQIVERDGLVTVRTGPVPARLLRRADAGGVAEPEAEAVHLAAADADLPFDTATGPLWRALLVRAADDDHVLTLTIDHLVADAESFSIVLRELAALYDEDAGGGTSPPPELPIQYGDFAAWQRGWLQSPERDELVARWRRILDGAPRLSEIPTDRARPQRREAVGATHRAPLSRELVARISAVSAAAQTTPFVVMLAAYALLVSAYSGQDDVVLGAPVSGRTQPELEPLVGCFLNMLCLRIDLGGSGTFRELVGRAHAAMTEALAAQALPFEELVRELRPERSGAHSPLFQLAFTARDVDAEPPQWRGIAAETIELSGEGSLWDVSLEIVLGPRGATAAWSYRDDLYEAATVARLATAYERLLSQAVCDPGQPVESIALAPAEELELQVREWNATVRPRDRRSIAERVHAQAARRPDAVAIEWGDASLTYRELEQRTTALARALRRRGVGPETRVALLLERGSDLVAALLAVSRVGAAWVPLDPTHPPERIAYALADARVEVALTERRVVDRLVLEPARTLLVEDAPQADEALPPPPVHPGALAFVVYTSGSTGRPKGVAISEGGLANLVDGIGDLVAFGPDDALLAVTTAGFDVASLELLLPLVRGGRVVLATTAQARDGYALRDLLSPSKPTVMHATPTTWRLLLDAGWGGDPALRALCGGETMPPELAAKLSRLTRLWNAYGPSETTIMCTTHPVVDADPAAPVPVGRPLPNTSVYVLDRDGALAPIGVPGEIAIGGAGLGRGYVDRPRLTAARFVPDPFATTPGGRLYRTGDRGRWRSDGTVEFLGRIDDQIKLRGVRIEPGEVERLLLEQPGVREAAVAVEDRNETAHLVAYLAADDVLPPASTLRTALSQWLPESMLPNVFVVVDALPRTATGKLDRSRLGDVAGRRLDADGEAHVDPEEGAEAVIADIWRSVLGVDRVGATDNFFDLGGHSLSLTQVRARLEATFGVAPPLADVVEHPTVRSLAAYVESLVVDQILRMTPAEVEQALAVADRVESGR